MSEDKKSQIKVSAGLYSLQNLQGRICPLPLPAVSSIPHSPLWSQTPPNLVIKEMQSKLQMTHCYFPTCVPRSGRWPTTAPQLTRASRTLDCLPLSLGFSTAQPHWRTVQQLSTCTQRDRTLHWGSTDTYTHIEMTIELEQINKSMRVKQWIVIW